MKEEFKITSRYSDDSIDSVDYMLKIARPVPFGLCNSIASDVNRIMGSSHNTITGSRLTGKGRKSLYERIFQPQIEFVIVNKIKNTTVVKFENGLLGKVKCTDEKFDVEKGIAMAILKALTKYKELHKILAYFDEKTANKIEKGIAIYLAKKRITEDNYNEAIKNAKIIEKKEDK